MSEFMHILFFQKITVLLQLFYGMVVIGSLSMVGDGVGCGGVRRVLGGCWEGVGRALASGEAKG